MNWMKKGVNYWENPNCPRGYLEGALVRLVSELEGVEVPIDHYKDTKQEKLIQDIAFYEEVASK